jgi:hypothetical protein
MHCNKAGVGWGAACSQRSPRLLVLVSANARGGGRRIKLNGPPRRRAGRDSAVPEELYTLRSVQSGNWMGFLADESDGESDATPYIIAFKYLEHARMVWSFAHEATKMNLAQVEMENITEQVEDMCGVSRGTFEEAGLPPVYADLDAHLCIDKRPNINKLGCDVASITTIDYLTIPFEQCIGVVMAKRLVHNTKNKITFESEVIDPIRDIDLFRKMLVESRE